jgi:hypothetical protein
MCHRFITTSFTVALWSIALVAHGQKGTVPAATEFPPELVNWRPCNGNPIFHGEGPGHWDTRIRERGWILREGGTFHLWFTGYDGARESIKLLGYATSPDGLHWTRSPRNPLVRDHWVEDVMVVKHGDTYYMFSEGSEANHAEMLTSKNGVDWKWEGQLDIRMADGRTPAQRPCGTPTIWIDGGTWYLFYEWKDQGVWLARSADPMSRVWINVQNEPVLSLGPAEYDKEMIALNQIIKYRGAYYGFYHGSGGGEPRTWNTNVARSTDLIHWRKYPRNPIMENNKSSGIVVPCRDNFRLYTMHDQVDVFQPPPPPN